MAWIVAKILEEEGADVLYCVRSEKRREELSQLIAAKRKIFVCDFEKQKDIEKLGESLSLLPDLQLDGVLHSIAFANYSEGIKPFHETKKGGFFTSHSNIIVLPS